MHLGMFSNHLLIPLVLIHKLWMPISWMKTWQVPTAGNVLLMSPEPTDGYLAAQEGCAEFVPQSFVYWSCSTQGEEYLHEVSPLSALWGVWHKFRGSYQRKFQPPHRYVMMRCWVLVDTGGLCLELCLQDCSGLPLTSRRTITPRRAIKP